MPFRGDVDQSELFLDPVWADCIIATISPPEGFWFNSVPELTLLQGLPCLVTKIPYRLLRPHCVSRKDQVNCPVGNAGLFARNEAAFNFGEGQAY